ncbi:MAG: hypothetical protein FWF90_04045 [Promicromonosporaceae bacterium]|nr:hypothetical protein [Promicromonosporaceae bacterium]
MTAAPTGKGFGRLVVTIYGILAFAAVGRSAYQIPTSAPHVPLAYWLSGFAAVVYVVAAVSLGLGRGAWRRLAWVTVGIEAVGVLTVGIASIFVHELRSDGTVWRMFGMDYGFFPLVLPFVGLWWLWRTRRAVEPSSPDPSSPETEPESER